jgi:hypothetical protein
MISIVSAFAEVRASSRDALKWHATCTALESPMFDRSKNFSWEVGLNDTTQLDARSGARLRLSAPANGKRATIFLVWPAMPGRTGINGATREHFSSVRVRIRHIASPGDASFQDLPADFRP